MRKISTIRLELSDWLYNAGIVGIANIFDANDVNYTKGINYIEFEDSALDNFEKKYFNYFIKKYDGFLTYSKWMKRIKSIMDCDIQEESEKYIELINKVIKDSKDKIKKSYGDIVKENNEELFKLSNNLKMIKVTKSKSTNVIREEIIEQKDILYNILIGIEEEKIKNKILVKDITGFYDQKRKKKSYFGILDKVWNVSFLNSEGFDKRFIEPIKTYINRDSNVKLKYRCFTCNNEIDKNCSFDLTWIHGIGVDANKKSSHFWNLYSDLNICPICNLVYLCVAAGFTIIVDNNVKKIDKNTATSAKGIFINENMNTDSLIKVNKIVLKDGVKFGDLQNEAYYNVAKSFEKGALESKERELDNIQIVMLDTENTLRPYTFNLLSKDMIKLIYKNKNRLEALINVKVDLNPQSEKKEFLYLYREVLNRLYNGKNQFDLINKLLYLRLEDKFSKIQFIDVIIKINNSFFEGRDRSKMVSYKTIDECRKAGLSLRNEYENRNAKNKLGGISYRLLNALKTKNTASFMDTLLNAYMYLGKQMPIYFVDVLKDVDRFQSIGYSFVLGLQGEEVNKDKEENKEEVK